MLNYSKITREDYNRMRKLYRKRGTELAWSDTALASYSRSRGAYVSVDSRPGRRRLMACELYLMARCEPVDLNWNRPYRWITNPICKTATNARLGFWRALLVAKAMAASRKRDAELARLCELADQKYYCQMMA